MDWIGIIGVLLGGTSLVGVIGFFVFFKQRTAKENLSVKEKDTQVSTLGLEVAAKAEEALLGKYDRIEVLEKVIQESNELIHQQAQKLRETDYIVKQHERKIIGMDKAIKRQVNRKRYAERLLCTVKECTLRTPPLGTFKSEDEEDCDDCEHNSLVKHVKLNKKVQNSKDNESKQ